MNKQLITIDGLAGTGKTSAASLLAKRLHFMHFSSGELYRVIGLLCLERGVEADLETDVLSLLDGNAISFEAELYKLEPRVNGEPVRQNLNTPEVSEATSKAARHGVVRERLVDLQRTLARDFSLVAEGRDMGTVIFPEAQMKFFLEVSAEVKVQRRIQQLQEAQMGEIDLNQLKNKMKIEIEERDERDRTRISAPTVPANDAIILNNSCGKLTELVETMYNMALERGLKVIQN